MGFIAILEEIESKFDYIQEYYFHISYIYRLAFNLPYTVVRTFRTDYNL